MLILNQLSEHLYTIRLYGVEDCSEKDVAQWYITNWYIACNNMFRELTPNWPSVYIGTK